MSRRCEQIPIPDLAIPGIGGLYFVVGGSITGSVSLTVTINQGTYTLSGGFIPGSNEDDISGVSVTLELRRRRRQPDDRVRHDRSHRVA